MGLLQDGVDTTREDQIWQVVKIPTFSYFVSNECLSCVGLRVGRTSLALLTRDLTLAFFCFARLILSAAFFHCFKSVLNGPSVNSLGVTGVCRLSVLNFEVRNIQNGGFSCKSALGISRVGVFEGIGIRLVVQHALVSVLCAGQLVHSFYLYPTWLLDRLNHLTYFE